MKKRVLIAIEIDTTNTEASVVADMVDAWPETTPLLAELQGTEAYVVKVGGGDTGNGENALDSCAHELGHVLSAIFKVPGGMRQDPRTNKEITILDNMLDNYSQNQVIRIWSNEQLAWALAEKIRAIDPLEKARCPQTYMRMVERHGGLEKPKL